MGSVGDFVQNNAGALGGTALLGPAGAIIGHYGVDSPSGVLDLTGGGSNKGDLLGGAGGNDLAGMSRALFKETDPLRKSLISRSESFLQNGDVTQNPAYAALKQGAEQQFGRAKQNILASTPTGGALTSALAGNEYQKAANLTQGMGGLYNQEMSRAMNLAAGTPLTAAFGGMSSAAQLQGQLAQAQASQDAAQKGALGQGAGLLAVGLL